MLWVIAAVVIVVTGIAVPWVVMSLRSAKAAVESGADITNAINRVEGYLQRDEQRELQREK